VPSVLAASGATTTRPPQYQRRVRRRSARQRWPGRGG
jgi:hypothetical protein